MALLAEEATYDGNMMVPLFEHGAAGDEARPPLVEIGAVLAAVGVDVFLRDAIDDRANSGPDTCARTHGTWLVRGVDDKIGEIAAVTAGNIFERFKFYVLDARAGSFNAVTGVSDDHFALANQSRDDGTDGIVAALTGAPSLGNGKFHELLSGFVGVRDHADRVYLLLRILDWPHLIIAPRGREAAQCKTSRAGSSRVANSAGRGA